MNSTQDQQDPGVQNSDADTSNNNSGPDDDDGPATPWTHDPDAPPPF
ncbi:hypothetical protein [Ornithinimicrobium murale]|nr:hypothetical protein [Ornithinimicrobium murale]